MKTLVCLLLLLCGRVHAEDLPPGAAAVVAGKPSPVTGVAIPGATLTALLKAQDERDSLLRDIARLQMQQEVDKARADGDLKACQGVSDARERAWTSCEAQRATPARCECPWGGWPIVTGVLSGAAGFGVGWVAR